MPNIASRFPKEFHWNKTFLMDKVVPPTVKCLICPTGVETFFFFPNSLKKNSLQDRHTCVFGTISVFLVQRIQHPFEQLMFEVV